MNGDDKDANCERQHPIAVTMDIRGLFFYI